METFILPFEPHLNPAVAQLTDEDFKGITRMEVQNAVEGYIYIAEVVSAKIVKAEGDWSTTLHVTVKNSKKAGFNGLPTGPWEPAPDDPYITTLLNTGIVSRSYGRLILENGINNELICFFPPKGD